MAQIIEGSNKMLSFCVGIIVGIWLFSGAVVTLCAMEFLQVKPSLAKIIVAFTVGPFAINRPWWVD
jgi:hypothetical protein